MNCQDMDYLGDGVYVGHDGYQVWITVNDHRNDALIALEPEVIKALVDYAKRVGILQASSDPEAIMKAQAEADAEARAEAEVAAKLEAYRQ